MQLFNQINARKLEPDDYNVLKNFFNNPLFFLIFIITIIVQMLMINFGGKAI